MNALNQDSPSLRQPAVFVPLIMSAAALALLLIYVAMFPRDAAPHDERAPARIFQLLIAGQLPVIAYLAFNWLPRAPIKTMLFTALQACAALTAVGSVIFMERA